MWQSVQEMTQIFEEDDDLSAGVQAGYSGQNGSEIPTLETPPFRKISQFHKNLKESTGNKLSELQNISLDVKDFNFIQFLQEIASEQEWRVTYVDIEEKSVSGKRQCLVHLDMATLPVAVCYGSGSTSKDAQAGAAHNTLEYLKIMTKK